MRKLVRQQVVMVVVLVTFNGVEQSFEIVLFLLMGSVRMRKYWIRCAGEKHCLAVNVKQSFVISCFSDHYQDPEEKSEMFWRNYY